MALEPGRRRSISPESSGRESPGSRSWRNQLGGEESMVKDKNYRKYASGVERALLLFETALQEWADYISFLNRLLKALQARPSSFTTIPAKATVAKRLSQCLNPSLPSGVHQKTLEVYNYVFTVIGKQGLSRDLSLYLPGLAPTLSFASLSVRSPFLGLLEGHLLELEARALRPAMKSLILALLPGLEEETAEDFERTLKLMERFKVAVRRPDSEAITAAHATGDDFFWQCFFLASITSHSRRLGALAYLVRGLPKLGHPLGGPQDATKTRTDGHGARAAADTTEKLSQLVTSPEPGLLLRCFSAGLADDQLLIQRGFLDLLGTHLPLHSSVLQKRVKAEDLELLMKAACGVTIRRDMSLNRRLWSWLLGPEATAPELESGMESPASTSNGPYFLSSRTGYFEEYGLQPLTRALLCMIRAGGQANPADRARPYRMCLSLMDRWEIGGLVVPEVFMPVVASVREFKAKAASKTDFAEVLKSANVFFDGVESGLIYSEMLALVATAVGPGEVDLAARAEKLDLVHFILAHFNVREEEMVTVHAPLTVLAILCMLHEARANGAHMKGSRLSAQALGIAAELLDLVPERAFPGDADAEPASVSALPNLHLLRRVREFYVNDQGNLEASRPPFPPQELAVLLLQKACTLLCTTLSTRDGDGLDVTVRARILTLLLTKTPAGTRFDVERLLTCFHSCLAPQRPLPFAMFTSALFASTHLRLTGHISPVQLSELVLPLVRHAWTFLSASTPKYHVETVRSLWHLQTAFSSENRDIEASICTLLLEGDTSGTYAVRPAESSRSFSVLWSHSLLDNPASSERRGSKTASGEGKSWATRLGGMDHYHVILSRPLFLMLDALTDETTQLFVTVRTWLNSLVGTEKLFRIFVAKIAELPYVRARSATSSEAGTAAPLPRRLGRDDDVDIGVYYLRTLSNVLRWGPKSIWAVLAFKTVPTDFVNPPLSEITALERDVTLQEFFLQACLQCIAGDRMPHSVAMEAQAAQLLRSALTVLHQILLSPYAQGLAGLGPEDLLIESLQQSLRRPDPYVQVTLLDAVHASLKLRDATPVESHSTPTPTNDKRSQSLDPAKTLRSPSSAEPAAKKNSPPPTLLRCIQAGLSAPSSRPVLDSWIGFLAECLPLYSDSIFPVLIPLVETLCSQIGSTFESLQAMFRKTAAPQAREPAADGPDSTLISLLNALELILARAHDRLLAEEARAQVAKNPEQPQGFFGNMVSGVFASDTPHTRSVTANDRLTVLLAFQDAVRMCFTIWSWGQGRDSGSQDSTSGASFGYTSLRLRNRARRVLEHLFAAETLECLETVIGIWRRSLDEPESAAHTEVFHLLPALDGSRPQHTVPALFHAIYSRTNPGALEPATRSSLMTVELQDTDLVVFLVDYARSLEDDAMDEIWADCMAFLKDLLANPFPHRQTLPSLLEFAAVLGEKVDNTNFGEQRKMRRELADLFARLLTAVFTTRPAAFADSGAASGLAEKKAVEPPLQSPSSRPPADRADDVVCILCRIVPNLPKILVENDRVLAAATAISANVIGPSLRSKSFPETMSKNTLVLLQELSRLPNHQKTWKKDVADAFNDSRFFASAVQLVQDEWLPLLRQWSLADKERMPELLGRLTPPTTAGIVFGVGATSARHDADRKAQLNLRRIATLILASPSDAFVSDLPLLLERLVELLAATITSSPSSIIRADLYLLARALVLKTPAVHLAPLWPILTAELRSALASVVSSTDTYGNAALLQACRLLDLLVCVAPDDFQLHEWLFVTDTVDAVSHAGYPAVALADEISEVLGGSGRDVEPASTKSRRPLLDTLLCEDAAVLEKREELVARVLRPFLGQLSIWAFEATYAMGVVDWDACVRGLLGDLFDERSIVRAGG